MANKILTASGWEQRIRDELGVDAAYLSDAALGQPEIIAVAEELIIEQVPNYASLTGTDRVFLEAATVCQCAVLVCPSLPARLPNRSQGPHATHELQTNWERRRAEIEEKRDTYLARLTAQVDISPVIVSGPARK